MNKDIKKETSIFDKKMQELSSEIIIINDKLNAYQVLQPTIEEVHDLKNRVDKLLLNLKNLNTNLCDIQETFNEFFKDKTAKSLSNQEESNLKYRSSCSQTIF